MQHHAAGPWVQHAAGSPAGFRRFCQVGSSHCTPRNTSKVLTRSGPPTQGLPADHLDPPLLLARVCLLEFTRGDDGPPGLQAHLWHPSTLWRHLLALWRLTGAPAAKPKGDPCSQRTGRSEIPCRHHPVPRLPLAHPPGQHSALTCPDLQSLLMDQQASTSDSTPKPSPAAGGAIALVRRSGGYPDPCASGEPLRCRHASSSRPSTSLGRTHNAVMPKAVCFHSPAGLQCVRHASGAGTNKPSMRQPPSAGGTSQQLASL